MNKRRKSAGSAWYWIKAGPLPALRLDENPLADWSAHLFLADRAQSMVKQMNLRVKGTEKFWSEGGGEAILQLRADHLSDDQPLKAFWQRRQDAATGQRPYRRVG